MALQLTARKWVYLIILSIIWGSSFILIKKGLNGLTPLQLGSARTLIGGIFLLGVGSRHLKTIPRNKWKWIAIGGFVGTFIPTFLFAYAETEIDSAIVSVLNSTVPLLALILGAVVFGIGWSRNQLVGLIIGLLGSLGLIYAGAQYNADQNYWYASFVIIACLCYAINVNLIKRYLQDVDAWGIATGNFVAILLPAMIVYLASGGSDLDYSWDSTAMSSLGWVVILAVLGTGVAKVMFNKLVQISSPIFASSVTYVMPIIGLSWGLLDGETFSALQLVFMLVIIVGVIWTNRRA